MKPGTTLVVCRAVEMHRALVDGLDVARYLERFQQALSDAPEIS